MLYKVGDYLNKYKFIAVIILGCILRLIDIGRVPGEYRYFQDEAISAYEAYSLLNYGIDSHGYHNPVYLMAGGNGMSAVQSYCQMLWIKLLGFTPMAIRLPQALLGCITLVFLYLLIKEMAEERIAFWTTLIFAISPWHIIMSRWGLACNYFIGFITIAMYFIVTSRNVLWRTIVAALFTGIALYSCASTWLVTPILIIGTIKYLYSNQEISKKAVIVYIALLFILSVPSILFVLVNFGVIGEIRTDIVSIPRFSYSIFDNIRPSISNITRLISYFWTQDDQILSDSVAKYGTFYLFSNVFLIIGFIGNLVKRNRKSFIMWLWLFCGFILGTFIEADFQRINILFIPLFYFVGSGVVFVIIFFEKYKTIDTVVLAVIYSVACISFVSFYFTDYKVMITRELPEGAKDAIEFAEKYDGTIHVSDIDYATVLCYSEYPTDKYVESVVYKDEKAGILEPIYYDDYDYTDYVGSVSVKGDVYICSVDNTKTVDWLAAQDMAFAQFGKFYLGVAN